MALTFKQLLVKNKIQQARLRGIRGILQGIPKKPSFESYEDEPYLRGYERGYEKARSELANELRKYANGEPSSFIPAGEMPGNTANGEPKVKTESEKV